MQNCDWTKNPASQVVVHGAQAVVMLLMLNEPEGHTVHTRLLVGVGAMLSPNPGAQICKPLQTGMNSDVPLSQFPWRYSCPAVQLLGVTVQAVQTVFEVGVHGCEMYDPKGQASMHLEQLSVCGWSAYVLGGQAMHVRSRVGVGSARVCCPAVQMVTGEQRGPTIDEPMHGPCRYSTCTRLGMPVLAVDEAPAVPDDMCVVG